MSAAWIVAIVASGLAVVASIVAAVAISRRRDSPAAPTHEMGVVEGRADAAQVTAATVATDPGASTQAAAELAQARTGTAALDRKALGRTAIEQARHGCYTGEDEPPKDEG